MILVQEDNVNFDSLKQVFGQNDQGPGDLLDDYLVEAYMSFV